MFLAASLIWAIFLPSMFTFCFCIKPCYCWRNKVNNTKGLENKINEIVAVDNHQALSHFLWSQS